MDSETPKRKKFCIQLKKNLLYCLTFKFSRSSINFIQKHIIYFKLLICNQGCGSRSGVRRRKERNAVDF